MDGQSTLKLFEICELIGILKSLDKSVDIAKMRHLCIFVFHATTQYIWNRAFLIKFETQLTVYSSVYPIDIFAAPNLFKIFKFLQFKAPYPFVKLLGLR